MDNSESKRISDGSRVEAFLNDEAVREALARMHSRYYGEFKNAATRDDREAAWAKARVLDDFSTELVAVIDSGKRASADKQRRERGTRAR